jgi:hypothetical protein
LHEKRTNDQLKEGEIVSHVARMGYIINTQKISVLRSKRDYLLNLGVDARIILKQILK